MMRVSRHVVGYSTSIIASIVVGAVLVRAAPRYFPRDVVTTPRYLERVSQFQIFTSSARNIMIGDSLTERGIWAELLPSISVANRGIGSTTVDVIRKNLFDVPRTARRAFVMAGVNDVAKGRKAIDIFADYKGLLSDLSMTKVDVVVQSTLMTKNRKWNSQIKELDQLLSEFCKQKDACTYVDLNGAMAADGVLRPDLTYDGIHLNGHGYEIWAQAIAPLMSRDDIAYSNPSG